MLEFTKCLSELQTGKTLIRWLLQKVLSGSWFFVLQLVIVYLCFTLLPIFIQLYVACRIPVISMYLQVQWKTVWILIGWLLRSQLIWIYMVFKIGYICIQHDKGLGWMLSGSSNPITFKMAKIQKDFQPL